MTKKLEDFLDILPEPNRSGCKCLLSVNYERFSKSPGSKTKHQAWKGGYIDHLEETMNIAEGLYETLSKTKRPLSFTLTDAILVIFFHDLEKPFKYVVPAVGFIDDLEKHAFILKKMDEYQVIFTDEQYNALQYIHGEGIDYHPTERIQGPLGAFVHCCDVISARIWFDYPKK